MSAGHRLPGRALSDSLRPPHTLLDSPISISDSSSDDVGTLLDKFVAVPAATRHGGIPATGWARVAMALLGLRGESEALLLIDLADDALIVVDWGRKDYWWQGGTGVFPEQPTISKVRVYRGDGARLPFMLEQPSELPALLWLVGIHAFPTSPAWWLGESMAYRLTRWPDFAALAVDPDDVSMTALLSKSALTSHELAAAAGVDLNKAQRLINALSLMRLVRETPPVVHQAPVAVAAPVVESKRGLFSRLRARLGV